MKFQWGITLKIKLFSITAILAMLLMPAVTPAQASSELQTLVTQALAGVTDDSSSQAISVLSNVAEAPFVESGDLAMVSVSESSEVTLPRDSREAVLLDLGSDNLMAITLPFSEEQSQATKVANGLVAFDNGNASVNVPVLKADGSVQFTTVLENRSAPTEYEYYFDLPEGATLQKAGDSVFVMFGDKFLGGIAPAWAIDSGGQTVPTWYEVTDTSIIQVVAHTDVEYQYPIVADPWVGIDLFGSITVDTYKSQPRVNLDLSPWGWFTWTGVGIGGLPSGQLILNSAGWDEAWNRSSKIRAALDKPSQRQQFACHALGAPFADTWNLEKFRPNRLNGNWGFGVAIHHCNWTTADQY